MRLSVNIFYLAKADKLISDNAFLSKYLEQDNNGGWFVDTHEMQEVERLLVKNRIRYRLTPV